MFLTLNLLVIVLLIMMSPVVLGELLQTTFFIKAAHETDPVLQRLPERIFSLMPAERGGVLFAGRKPGTLDSLPFRVHHPMWIWKSSWRR
jgi:hypothetical protein